MTVQPIGVLAFKGNASGPSFINISEGNSTELYQDGDVILSVQRIDTSDPVGPDATAGFHSKLILDHTNNTLNILQLTNAIGAVSLIALIGRSVT